MGTLRDAFLSGSFERNPNLGTQTAANIDRTVAATEAQQLQTQFAPAREERAVQQADIQAQTAERAKIDAAKKGILESEERERIEGVRVARSVFEVKTPEEFAFLQRENPIDLGQSTFEDAKLSARFLLAANDEIEQEKTVTDPQIVKLQNAFDATNDPVKRRQIRAQIEKLGTIGKGVSISVGGKPKDTGQFGGALVARTTNIIERGEKADATLNMVAEMRNSLGAVEGGVLDVGALAEFRLGLASLAQTFGISDSLQTQIANAENFQSLANTVVLAESEAMKGVLSDNDVRFLKTIAPQLDKTGLGNDFLLTRMENVALMDKIKFNRGQQIEQNNPDLNNLQVSKMLDDEFSNIPYVGRNLRTDVGMPIFFASFYNNLKAVKPEKTIQDAANEFRALDVE